MQTVDQTFPAVSQRFSPRRVVTACLAALVFAAGGFGLLHGKSSAPQAESPERTTPWLENGVIHYPPAFGARENITFAEAVDKELTPTLSLTGEVQWDQRRVTALGARIEGRLRAVHKIEGQDVAAGEVVAELESVELGRAQAEVLKVRAREQAARLDAERERKLADLKVSAERDAQFALANADALTAERVAAEKAVEALGGSLSGDVGVLKLRSPIAGHAVEVKLRRGETVSSTDRVMLIADRSKVWGEFTIFERDVAAVHQGDAVEIRVPGDRTHVIAATVFHVSESLDPDTRAGHVRVELDNSAGLLRVGQSVTATILASGRRERQLVVPKQAVTRVDGVPTVFVQVGAGAVEPRRVTLSFEDASAIAVVDGLKAGERVAAGGVLALKAEVFR
jgi:membrane fusion protein, heavy metal efflux system